MRRVYIISPGRSCVDPASSLPLSAGGGFTQLRSGNKYIYAMLYVLPRSSWPSGGRILVTVDIHSRTKSLPIDSSKNYS